MVRTMTSVPTPVKTATPRRIALLVALLVAVLSGCLVAVQSRINGELARQIDDGYFAALVSFSLGLVILSIALVFFRPGRRGLAQAVRVLRSGEVPWWHFCGGASGAFFVLSQGLTASLLGVALFTVATVCGQTISGLLIDRSGLGTMPAKAVTWSRLVGSAIALAAVVWAVSGELAGSLPLWALIMPFIAGLAVGWQQAVNGQVRELSKSAFTGTYVNFAVGTALLLVIAIVHLSIVGWPSGFPMNPVLYLGGPIGIIVITATIAVVRITGVLLLGLAYIAGQLVGSLVIDIVLPSAGEVIAWSTVAGTVVTLAAVLLAAVPSRPIRFIRKNNPPTHRET